MLSASKRIIPLFDRVLVKRGDTLCKTKGGIVIPDKSKKNCKNGVIIAIGPGRRDANGTLVPSTLKAGDAVLLPEYGGQKVEMDNNEEFRIFREADILATLNV